MKYPPAPAELIWALSVSIEGIRPWEYWAMDSEEYDLIREVQAVYRSEVMEEQKAIKRSPDG